MTSNPSGPGSDLEAILESIRSRVTGEIGDAVVAMPVRDLPKKPAHVLPTPIVENGGVTVDALFRAMLEPMLRAWMDANLPEICERVAQAEIRRLTGQS